MFDMIYRIVWASGLIRIKKLTDDWTHKLAMCIKHMRQSGYWIPVFIICECEWVCAVCSAINTWMNSKKRESNIILAFDGKQRNDIWIAGMHKTHTYIALCIITISEFRNKTVNIIRAPTKRTCNIFIIFCMHTDISQKIEFVRGKRLIQTRFALYIYLITNTMIHNFYNISYK